ncbi:SRPBCC family protein [Pyxidicoccus sp. 3LFB2]
MLDIAHHLNAIHREVGKRPDAGGEVIGVLLRRGYDASIEDVWSALTDRDRLKQWFLPVSGELTVGGRFQLEGNAGGEILQCTRPHRVRVTFGAPTSIVELRLSARGPSDTVLELEHTVPLAFVQNGAGSLYVGPGWDNAFMALARFLRGEVIQNPATASSSPEGQEFSKQSVHAWAAAVKSSNTATADEIAAAAKVSMAQFAPSHAGAGQG